MNKSDRYSNHLVIFTNYCRRVRRSKPSKPKWVASDHIKCLLGHSKYNRLVVPDMPKFYNYFLQIYKDSNDS